IELVDQDAETKDQKDSDGKQRAPDDMGAGIRIGSVGWVGHGGSFGDANFPGLRRRAFSPVAALPQVKRLVFRQTAKRGVPRSFCYGSRLPSRLSAAVPTSESACAASLPVFSITLSVSSST